MAAAVEERLEALVGTVMLDRPLVEWSGYDANSDANANRGESSSAASVAPSTSKSNCNGTTNCSNKKAHGLPQPSLFLHMAGGTERENSQALLFPIAQSLSPSPSSGLTRRDVDARHAHARNEQDFNGPPMKMITRI